MKTCHSDDMKKRVYEGISQPAASSSSLVVGFETLRPTRNRIFLGYYACRHDQMKH